MTEIDYPAVAQLAEKLLQAKRTMATAESCTGGMIASTCISLSGSSQWFDRGFVTYSNNAKIEQLSVPETLIAHYGAVSEACARAMLQGLLIHSKADYGVCASGIAGPTGGTVEKPVGTVWLSWGSTKHNHAQCYHFSGDRTDIRIKSCNQALHNLLNCT